MSKCIIVVKEIVVDEDKCTRCLECVKYCPLNVLVDRGDGVPKPDNLSSCIACIGCMAVCEVSAIRIIPEWRC